MIMNPYFKFPAKILAKQSVRQQRADYRWFKNYIGPKLRGNSVMFTYLNSCFLRVTQKNWSSTETNILPSTHSLPFRKRSIKTSHIHDYEDSCKLYVSRLKNIYCGNNVYSLIIKM